MSRPQIALVTVYAREIDVAVVETAVSEEAESAAEVVGVSEQSLCAKPTKRKGDLRACAALDSAVTPAFRAITPDPVSGLKWLLSSLPALGVPERLATVEDLLARHPQAGVFYWESVLPYTDIASVSRVFDTRTRRHGSGTDALSLCELAAARDVRQQVQLNFKPPPVRRSEFDVSEWHLTDMASLCRTRSGARETPDAWEDLGEGDGDADAFVAGDGDKLLCTANANQTRTHTARSSYYPWFGASAREVADLAYYIRKIGDVSGAPDTAHSKFSM
jgi:hypothetical protein